MAEWKKVLLKGDNVTTELLKATDGTYVPASDSVLFADDGDGSGVIKKESGAAFATALAGTAAASGLTAASGALKLNTGADISGGLDAAADLIIVKDATDGHFKTATVTSVSSAAASNTTYTLNVADTDADTATINLIGTDGNNDAIAINVNVAPDGTGSSGELTINTPTVGSAGAASTIDIGMNSAFTTVTSILNSGLVVGRDAHNQIDFSTDNKITIKTNNSNNDAVQLNTTAFQPVNDGALELGLTGKRWKEGWFDKATVDNIVLDSTTIQHQDGATALSFKGTADDATKVATTNVSNDAAHHLLFVNADDSTNQGAETATALTYNPGTSTLVCTNITGTASLATSATTATTATTANKVKINDADATDDTFYFLFSDSHGGNSQDVYADSSFHWNPNDETLTVTNLKVSGTSTTVNTTDLIVQDKMIVVANGSAAVGDADGAGITVDVGATEANMPELKWNNNSKLTGWTVSTYDASGATDFPVAVMTDGDGAPSGTAAGSGSFYVDTNAGNLDLYVYI